MPGQSAMRPVIHMQGASWGSVAKSRDRFGHALVCEECGHVVASSIFTSGDDFEASRCCAVSSVDVFVAKQDEVDHQLELFLEYQFMEQTDALLRTYPASIPCSPPCDALAPTGGPLKETTNNERP